ncbi:MAG: hypothetical protein QOH88_3443 [Verrucomicrobiota bacterium]|jgi:TPR repeat protein
MRTLLRYLVPLFSFPLHCLPQGAPLDKYMDISPAEMADRKAKYQEAEKTRTEGNLVASAKLYRAVVETGLKTTSFKYDQGLDYAAGAEPIKWFRKLAETGNVDAQFLLGRAYSRGRTVAVNPVEAFKWFMAAANQGDAEAQYEVGSAYQLGHGVKQSNSEASKWWKKAAAQGHEQAAFMVKKMESKGD